MPRMAKQYIDGIQPDRQTVSTVAEVSLVAFLLGSLTPCSGFCAAISSALDYGVASDQFLQGDFYGGALTLAPGLSGSSYSKILERADFLGEITPRAVNVSGALGVLFWSKNDSFRE